MREGLVGKGLLNHRHPPGGGVIADISIAALRLLGIALWKSRRMLVSW